MNGNLVKIIDQYSANDAIDVSMFKAGMYFIEIMNNKKEYMKFIKK
jgi:hypothetical protein